ncbi:hypothetical protein LCGC14_1968970 [marine sediment metagenome]|uniref:Uncharacterized protein n=1 Tax=marine sediment metagenome TaxID=412755 RepID=A0A0F9HQS6_9ZZZZ
MPEELEVSVHSAFQAAVAELEGEAPSEAETALPAVEAEPPAVQEQAETDPVEQAEEVADANQPEVDAEMQDLFNDFVEGEAGEADAEAEVDPVEAFVNSEEFLTTKVELKTSEGNVTVEIGELTDGYLRQSDYTVKTQEVAAEREGLKEASEFIAAFREDPVAFARSMAVQAGLLEEGAEPVKAIDVAKVLSPEDMEAEIGRRVDERFDSDPRTADLVLAQAQVTANAEFARIEKTHSVNLTPEVRQSIIDEAARRGTGDLELVSGFLLNQAKAKRSQGSLRDAAPSRPTRPAAPGSDAEPSKPVIVTPEDAFIAAEAELANVTD